MRPQQQNRRMRGRGNNNNNNNNNNRKGPNPLTRSYESNGPDVKIRGTAQQVAEKYTTLASDAQSSGDRVIAENYLQHAEHYNRIIMTAQAAQIAQQQQQRDNQDDSDDANDNNDQGNRNHDRNDQGRSDRDRNNQNNQNNQMSDNNRQQANGSGPQPVIEGVPAEVAHSQQDQPRDNRHRDNGNQNHGHNGETVGSQDAQVNGQDDAPAADAAPKRPRRPRKPRETTPVAGEGDSGGNDTEQPTETIG